jgi:hypothetical protein
MITVVDRVNMAIMAISCYEDLSYNRVAMITVVQCVNMANMAISLFVTFSMTPSFFVRLAPSEQLSEHNRLIIIQQMTSSGQVIIVDLNCVDDDDDEAFLTSYSLRLLRTSVFHKC